MVVKPETAGRSRRAPLTRRRILDAALELVDGQGIGALSMRKLAAELGVEAMSLYNHVPNKAAVLSGLAELVLDEIDVPSQDLHWVERLRRLARATRTAFQRHPAVVAVLASQEASLTTLTALAPIENALDALHAANVDDVTSIHAYRALVGLIFGQAVLEAGGLPGTTPGAAALPLEVPPGLLPRLHGAMKIFPNVDTDDDFEFALEAIIAAVERKAGF